MHFDQGWVERFLMLDTITSVGIFIFHDRPQGTYIMVISYQKSVQVVAYVILIFLHLNQNLLTCSTEVKGEDLEESFLMISMNTIRRCFLLLQLVMHINVGRKLPHMLSLWNFS